MQKQFCVYIMASHLRRLYVGMTNDLPRRIDEHKTKQSAFTTRYNIFNLVYVESFLTAKEAILREKQLKGWLRVKKIELIESANPDWQDLSASFVCSKSVSF